MPTGTIETAEQAGDNHSKRAYAKAPMQNQEDAEYIQGVSKYSFIEGAKFKEQQPLPFAKVTSEEIDAYLRKMKVNLKEPVSIALLIELMVGFTNQYEKPAPPKQ